MNKKAELIKNLEIELAETKKKRDWYWDQHEGLDRQLSRAYEGGRPAPFDEYYSDTKDLIRQRRNEAWDSDKQIKELKKELKALKDEG